MLHTARISLNAFFVLDLFLDPEIELAISFPPNLGLEIFINKPSLMRSSISKHYDEFIINRISILSAIWIKDPVSISQRVTDPPWSTCRSMRLPEEVPTQTIISHPL
ncbi:hypothetical protein CEXT_756211 [Caerostris extrusa]|uniref:Uncharacterized protein n=1 Tax=Caerostris extrusa TaxID=172846 RepID=A0AAV4RR10_CAEEX|nr:hypothetical protein CEXT_756211 [Caerostris extrusa]